MPAFFCAKCDSRIASLGSCDACDPGGQPQVLEVDGALVPVAAQPAAPAEPEPSKSRRK